MPQRKQSQEQQIKVLQKEVRNLKAVTEMLYEMLATQTVIQAQAAFEAQRDLSDPKWMQQIDSHDTSDHKTDEQS